MFPPEWTQAIASLTDSNNWVSDFSIIALYYPYSCLTINPATKYVVFRVSSLPADYILSRRVNNVDNLMGDLRFIDRN